MIDSLEIRRSYQESLFQLFRSRAPIGQNDERLLKLFPHLLPEEAMAVLKQRKFIAAPSLMIEDTFHVIGYSPDDNARVAYHGCLPAKSFGPGNILYVERAKKFAKFHWPQKFFRGEFKFVVSFILRFFDRPGAGNDNIKAVWLLVNKDLALILASEKPRSKLLDLGTVYATVNPLEAREAGAVRDTKLTYVCGHCGSPLNDRGCAICSDKEVSCYPDFSLAPLPRPVVEFLKLRGHIFSTDPYLALERERKRSLA
jgi:hypothetical protein